MASGSVRFLMTRPEEVIVKLVAHNYRYVVTADGDGTIRLHGPGGVLIGMLFGHTPPALGNDADALWDAAQWLLMAPQDGSGVDADFWANHLPSHIAWLESEKWRDDILWDFAEAAASEGSEDARNHVGYYDDWSDEELIEWEIKDEAESLRAEAIYDAEAAEYDNEEVE